MPTDEKRIKFIVRRRFKYGKRWFMPGEEFEPAGGKFDDAILMSNLIYRDAGDFRHPNRVSARRHAKRDLRIGAKAVERIRQEQPVTDATSLPALTKRPASVQGDKKPAAPRKRATPIKEA